MLFWKMATLNELQYTDKAQPSEEDWVTASSSGYYDEDEDEYYEMMMYLH